MSYAYDQANRLASADPTGFARAVSGGWYHSASVDSDGNVWTWGYNGYGQLGTGNTTDSLVPAKLTSIGGVVAVAASAYNTVALKADGTVWAWGTNTVGQVGDGTTTQRNPPVQVSGLSGIVAIASGASHSLALRNDGMVWAWGYNANGGVGDGSTTDRATPVQVSGLADVTAIAGGYTSSYALRSDGTVWAWGYNGFGNLGDGTTTNRTTPVQVSGLSGVGGIASGYFHVLAAKGNGPVVGWGYNGNGQIGDGTTAQRNTPVAVPGLSAVNSLAANSYFSLAARTDGTVATWGWNAYGQLASGNTTDVWTPQTRASLADAKGLAAGANHALSLRPDASATAWGWNGSGTLGTGNTANSSTPVAVSTYSRGTKPLAAYTYTGDGLRATKKVAGVTATFTWDASGPVPLLIDDGTNFYIYGPDGTPLEHIDRSNNVTWYHHDQLGSTRVLSNNTGATIATATYDPYGRLTGSTGKLSPLGFAGEFTDAETGFVYLRARYYDPATGQFLTRDPLEVVSRDPYGYAFNDPINTIDPSGMLPSLGDIAGGIGDFLTGGDCGDGFLGAAGNLLGDLGELAWEYKWDIALTAAMFVPGVGTAAWSYRAYRIVQAAKVTQGMAGGIRATRATSWLAGRMWVGVGSRTTSIGGRMSANGLRQTRPFTFKPQIGTTQMNFESRLVSKGDWINNYHVQLWP